MILVLGYQKLNVYELQSDRKSTLWYWYLVNSVDPGLVSTDICSHGERPVEEGPKALVWAATLSDEGPCGGFFFDGKSSPW